jgi:hypothetical protein
MAAHNKRRVIANHAFPSLTVKINIHDTLKLVRNAGRLGLLDVERWKP